MKKDKTIRILFISGTVFIAIFFIVMVINIYDYTLNDAKKNHQMQQMEMAKAAVSGISIYLSGLTDDMRLLSNYPGVKNFDKKIIKTNTDLLLDHYNDKIVKTIFILDGEGRPVYYTGANPPASLYYGPDFDIKALQNNVPRFFKIEPFYRGNIKSGLIFVMLMPFGEERTQGLFESSGSSAGKNGEGLVGERRDNFGKSNSESDNGKGKFIREGYIGFIVSFDSLIHKYIVPLKLGEKDFAWIMDGGGRLIYHPTHKDMLLRSITGTSSTCLKCHYYTMILTMPGLLI